MTIRDTLPQTDDLVSKYPRSSQGITHSAEMVTNIASRRDIDRYLRHLKTRKCSPSTLRTCRSILHGLAARAAAPILDLDTDDLEAWQELRATRLTASALRTQINYVRNFYKWAIRNDLITQDPTRLMDMPRAPRRRPRPISEQRLREAIAAADVTMAAILGLAAFAGLRAGEVAGLDWSDVQLGGEHPQMRITAHGGSKGGHEEPVDISPQLADLIGALQVRRRGPVIPRADGEPGHNTPTRISQMANRHLRACDIPDTYHGLRHRFVTKAYESAKSIRAAQRAARHASITSTALYTAVEEEAVRSAVYFAGTIAAS